MLSRISLREYFPRHILNISRSKKLKRYLKIWFKLEYCIFKWQIPAISLEISSILHDPCSGVTRYLPLNLIFFLSFSFIRCGTIFSSKVCNSFSFKSLSAEINGKKWWNFYLQMRLPWIRQSNFFYDNYKISSNILLYIICKNLL